MTQHLPAGEETAPAVPPQADGDPTQDWDAADGQKDDLFFQELPVYPKVVASFEAVGTEQKAERGLGSCTVETCWVEVPVKAMRSFLKKNFMSRAYRVAYKASTARGFDEASSRAAAQKAYKAAGHRYVALN